MRLCVYAVSWVLELARGAETVDIGLGGAGLDMETLGDGKVG